MSYIQVPSMANDSSNVDAVAVTSTSKTGFLSLPEEVLLRIFKEVAGKVVLDEENQIYSRNYNGSRYLRNLRLVDRRFASIAQLETYCAPNTMKYSSLEALSCDDLHILIRPGVTQLARKLSLAGSAAFFAGLLSASFRHITALSLVFSVVHVYDLSMSQTVNVTNVKSLKRLRQTLRTLPLQELRISYPQGGIQEAMSSEECMHTVLLGAAHPTIRHFFIEGDFDRWGEDSKVAEVGGLPPIDASFLASITVRDFTQTDVQLLLTGLGNLPKLSSLIMKRDDYDWEDMARTLAAFTPRVGASLASLTLTTCSLQVELWQALADLPALEVLILEFVPYCQDEAPDTLRLPNLRSLRFHVEAEAIDAYAVMFHWATRTDLLPKLLTVYSKMENDDCSFLPAVALEAGLAAYRELCGARSNIKVHPEDFEEWTLRLLAQKS